MVLDVSRDRMGWPGVASPDQLAEEPGVASVLDRRWPMESPVSDVEGAAVVSAAFGALRLQES